MRVVVAGAGLMGSQIGCEYALGGHDVAFVARRPADAARRIEAAFFLVSRFGLFSAHTLGAARARVRVLADLAGADASADVVIEAIVEDAAAKGRLLAEAAARMPAAILATNTSSLSISALGEAAGAPARTVGTHYWNPPLLMPLVEIISGDATDPAVVHRMAAILGAMGKRPVTARRDVPGFIWNRLQMALLREAAWIVEHGVATPEVVDEVVRDGLARRWRLTGPFETAALGGAETFARIAGNLFPVLSTAHGLDDLDRWLDPDPVHLARLREARDEGLVAELRRDREAAGGVSA